MASCINCTTYGHKKNGQEEPLYLMLGRHRHERAREDVGVEKRNERRLAKGPGKKPGHGDRLEFLTSEG